MGYYFKRDSVMTQPWIWMVFSQEFQRNTSIFGWLMVAGQRKPDSANVRGTTTMKKIPILDPFGVFFARQPWK
jgi:hypothetical protein